jgi:ribonuclease D
VTGFEFVDLQSSDQMVSALQATARIGLDTEFMREKTFFAELCLVQLSLGDRIYCADPVGVADLSGFWTALTRCEWVLHAGRQDMEVIYQVAGQMPERLFDTQIAAALLGYAPQLGYAGLVSELFNVELDKSHTRADWSRRPLPAEVMRYAAEDVEYLLPAFEILNERLERLGRQSWAVQDSLDLLDRTLYETDVTLAIERVKGARNMQGTARSVARALAEWRETEALRRNRPRQWILRDAVLLELSQTRPTSTHALRAIAGLPAQTVARAGDELLRVIAAGMAETSDYLPPLRPNERQKAILKTMQKTVASCAAGLGISAEIVAPKKELSAALLGKRESRVFRGWRRGLVGETLLAQLDNA